MESRAPYQSAAAPQGPRNLAAPLGQWLRTLGFTTSEQAFPTLTLLSAHWLSSSQERFELTYTWQAGPCADATLQLRVLSPAPSLRMDTLCSAQRVRRLKEVRQLVSNCVRLSNARLLAQPVPLPATS